MSFKFARILKETELMFINILQSAVDVKLQ